MVLSALNSPVITNITMGPKDIIFIFINRADPNGQLMGEYFYNLFVFAKLISISFVASVVDASEMLH